MRLTEARAEAATLLSHALEGAAAAGAQTQVVHLCDLAFKGCTSCFAYKRKGSALAGHCAQRDEPMPVLDLALADDVLLLLGSPLYLGALTGAMKCFERLGFPNLSYDVPDRLCFEGRAATGFVYAMGMPHDLMERSGYRALFEANKSYLHLFRGPSECVVSADNRQFARYGNYAASNFNEQHKVAVQEERFPAECREAFKMGARLCAPYLETPKSDRQRGLWPSISLFPD